MERKRVAVVYDNVRIGDDSGDFINILALHNRVRCAQLLIHYISPGPAMMCALTGSLSFSFSMVRLIKLCLSLIT